MKHLFKPKAGFTLVELLVVITIIGLLATISTISINVARVKARDVKRQADMAQIQLALFLYYDDHNAYPVADFDLAHAADPNWTILTSALNGNGGADKIYMARVPLDSLNASPYVYGYNSDGVKYQLSWALEEGGAKIFDYE